MGKKIVETKDKISMGFEQSKAQHRTQREEFRRTGRPSSRQVE
jgi:hypothetical protein